MQTEIKFLERTLRRLFECSQHLSGIPRLAEIDVAPKLRRITALLDAGNYANAMEVGDQIAQEDLSLCYAGEAVLANLVFYADERDGLSGAVRAWCELDGGGSAKKDFYRCCDAVLEQSLHLRISVLAEAIALTGKQSNKVTRLLDAYQASLNDADESADADMDGCDEEPDDEPEPACLVKGSVDLNFVIASARYASNFPDGDAFIDAAFAMADAAKNKRFMFTIIVFSGRKPVVGTFGWDNYGSLPLFAMEFHSQAQKGASVMARRFEDGPNERTSGHPYKTIAGASFRRGKWTFLDEDEAKAAHTVDHRTGKYIPIEKGVLFSTIPEMLPNFLDGPKFSKTDDACGTDI